MDVFVGEIRPFAFNLVPKGWAACAGQLMPISRNTALFSLLGTYYGGDGKTTFALPNLQGQIPIGAGQGPGLADYYLGESGGAPSSTLLPNELPPHSHTLPASPVITTKVQAPAPHTYLGTTGSRSAAVNVYINAAGQSTTSVKMLSSAVSPAGGGQAHNNMAPYLAVNYCIALEGVFPPRA